MGVHVGIGEGFVVAVGVGVGVEELVAVAAGGSAEVAVLDASVFWENVHAAPMATMTIKLRTVVAISGAEGRFPLAIVKCCG